METSATAPSSPVHDRPGEIPVAFSGRGSEYFGIWIVNLLLSILTLGIYSAWAKVRRERYFHSHTLVDGASFEYHGDPKAILKGRLIAFGLLLAYNLSFRVSPLLGAVTAVLLAAVFPWLLVKSLRFRLANSSYRGLRFSFRGSVRDGYVAFLAWPILTLFSLGLLAPFAHQRVKHFQHGNLRFGTAQAGFDVPVAGFYKIYLKTFGLALLVLVLVGALFAFSLGASFAGPMTPGKKLALALIPFALAALLSLFIAPYFQARIQNLVWNGTHLGDLRVHSDVRAHRLLLIRITNLLAILFTLGLFKPFAVIRSTRYRLECLALAAPSGLDHFIAGEADAVQATGEEAAEMFDLDIGL